MSADPAGRRAARLAMGLPDAEGPVERSREEADGPSMRSVLEILRLNKVPLLTLPAGAFAAPSGGSLSPEDDDAVASSIARERRLAERLGSAYARVRERLGESGIRTVLFKSPRWFPYLSSNLDVLVEPGAFGESARLVEDLGHLRFPHYREDHKLLFRSFEEGTPSLSVHLHEAVSWGKILVLEGEGVVGRSVPGEDPGIAVASAGDALATTLAHTILETDQVRLSDLRIVRWSLDHGATAETLLDGARERRWEAAAASALLLYDAVCRVAAGEPLLPAAGRAAAEESLRRFPFAARLLEGAMPGGGMSPPHRLGRGFSKRHLLRLIMGDDRRDPAVKIHDLAASAWNLVANRSGIRCRPARLITVSGPDGAGKSGVAESILATLRLCEVPATRVWSRGGFSRAAGGFKSALRRAAPGAVPGPRDERGKRDFLRSAWRRRLWAWLVVLEQAAALQRIRFLLLLGRTVVCDRYVYDTIADMASRLPRGPADLPSRAAGFLLGAVPSPDVAFVILVDPDVAHARKEDGTSLASRRDLARSYATVHSLAPFEVLDGGLPLALNAHSAIVTALRATFGAFDRRPR